MSIPMFTINTLSVLDNSYHLQKWRKESSLLKSYHIHQPLRVILWSGSGSSDRIREQPEVLLQLPWDAPVLQWGLIITSLGNWNKTLPFNASWAPKPQSETLTPKMFSLETYILAPRSRPLGLAVIGRLWPSVWIQSLNKEIENNTIWTYCKAPPKDVYSQSKCSGNWEIGKLLASG